MTAALIQITTDIVSAYVSNNNLRPQDLADLIRDVHGKLAELAADTTEAPVAAKPEPPVPVKKSITPGYLISLEDGRRYKTLRRHLSTRGLTPDEYRAKWGLPSDYPMVAKDYAESRSALAKQIGLGRKAANAEPGDQAQAIADDLIEVIAEDVIGDEVATPKKAARKVTPHLKPKDRATAKRAAKPAGDDDAA